jgi:hypothetical protein
VYVPAVGGGVKVNDCVPLHWENTYPHNNKYIVRNHFILINMNHVDNGALIVGCD